MRRWALLLALLLSLPVRGASEPGTAPTAPGAAPPASSLPAGSPATGVPVPGGPASPAPSPAPTAVPTPEPAPAVPATTPPVAPGAPPRQAGSLLDQPRRQAPPPQWGGVVSVAADDMPALREWLVVAADLAEAERQRQALQPFGLRILRRQQLPSLGMVLSVFRLPVEADAQQLLYELRQRFPDWQQELNLRFRPLAQPDAAELQLRTWGQRAMGVASRRRSTVARARCWPCSMAR